MNELLRRKRRGAAAMEWVILSPLMILSFMALLYLLFIGLAYIQYNNLANTISQDLNMRQSGYKDTQVSEPYIVLDNNPAAIVPTGDGSTMDSFKQFISGFQEASSTRLRITGNSKEIQQSANYSAENHKDRFYMPGVVATNLRVDAMRNGAAATHLGDASMSGTIIETRIEYKCFGFSFVAKGYNIIS